jgi:glucan phosphoethanolaminetransferase (alkaline phosphatase superfamily)
MTDQLGPAHNRTDAPSRPPLRDRFTISPILIVLVLAGVFFVSAYASNNFDRYGGIWFFALLFVLVAALADFVLLIIRLGRRRWRAAISLATALGILAVCFSPDTKSFSE